MSNERIKIYTDGACLGNPGPGGFSWILLFQDRKIEHADSETETTNNRMELSAVINALKYFDENKKSSKKYILEIFTDSNLIVQAINQRWLTSWASKGWKKADKEPVKNPELWADLLKYIQKYEVIFNWVKGHAGDEFNERCDTLARDAAKGALKDYHKMFKLVKNDDSLSAKSDNIEKVQTKNIRKMENLKGELQNQFLFHYDKKNASLTIEQLSADLLKINHEIQSKIVIDKMNFSEFEEKYNLIKENFKENDK